MFYFIHRFGYSKEVFNSTDDWDVMWAHDYPFKKIREKMLAMKPGQKVNKFPGSGFITESNSIPKTDRFRTESNR